MLSFIQSASAVKTNARIRYLPDDSGNYEPYEMLVFPSETFVPEGWEAVGRKEKLKSIDELAEEAETSSPNPEENRRKSFQRSRNNLFNLLLCTLQFDCFVTLTLSPDKIDRLDYNAIMKKWRVWFDNRVRRNGLVYAFVPEYHKNASGIHFHGLCNMSALNLVRAYSPYTSEPLFDNEGRPIYNIKDFPYGFNTVIPLSGENARIATAKYCYKYITKSKGEKIGGRYYLSGGALGRPRYDYVNVDYNAINAPEILVNGTIRCKKLRL